MYLICVISLSPCFYKGTLQIVKLISTSRFGMGVVINDLCSQSENRKVEAFAMGVFIFLYFAKDSTVLFPM